MLRAIIRLIVFAAVIAQGMAGLPQAVHAHAEPAPPQHHAMAAGHHDAMTGEHCTSMPTQSQDAADQAADCCCAVGVCAAVLATIPSPVGLTKVAAAVLLPPPADNLTATVLHPLLRPPRA